jgi:hypothetical protein
MITLDEYDVTRIVDNRLREKADRMHTHQRCPQYEELEQTRRELEYLRDDFDNLRRRLEDHLSNE